MASDTPAPTTWLWLRHAPTRTPTRLAGRADPATAPVAPARLAVLAARLPPVITVLSSPARRCRETLAALRAVGADLPPESVEPALWEQDFGAWEGADPASCAWPRNAGAETLAAFAPPQGESFAAVCTRVGTAIQARASALPGDTILACAHAGTIRAALVAALGSAPAAGLAFDIRPLSLTRLTAFAGGWRVDAVNLEADS